MVNWLLGHHPSRFAAGVSENPVTDLVSHFGTCDFATWVGPTAVGVRFPHENPDRYRELSPASQIHRNKAPLLLLQCEGDLRCPPDQTEIVFGILARARPRGGDGALPGGVAHSRCDRPA